jgi:copper chaperone CopZ
MLWLLLGLVVVGAFIYWVNRDSTEVKAVEEAVKNVDVKAAVTKAADAAKGFADVNKDGKVNVADVKEAGKKAKAGAKKVAAKVKKPKLKVAK